MPTRRQISLLVIPGGSRCGYSRVRRAPVGRRLSPSRAMQYTRHQRVSQTSAAAAIASPSIGRSASTDLADDFGRAARVSGEANATDASEARRLARERTVSGSDHPRREFQELWFALARREWRSVVLVPADAGESAAAAATSLAEVGRQLHEFPVTLFVMANPLDYWPALQIVSTAASMEEGREGSDARTGPANSLGYASAVQMVASAASTGRGSTRPSTGKVIIAVQPVVVAPLGLAVTQAADASILCIEMGRTHLAAARRTIELVGRERIAGCLLIS